MVSLHLKAVFVLVCLKRFVIFLICGDVYVNVVHFVSCLEVVGGVEILLITNKSLFVASSWSHPYLIIKDERSFERKVYNICSLG